MPSDLLLAGRRSEHSGWSRAGLSGERPARGAELAGHTARRFNDRGGEAARWPAREHAIRVTDNGDGADGVARAIKDRRGNAGFAEDRLVALGRHRLEADRRELGAQRG